MRTHRGKGGGGGGRLGAWFGGGGGKGGGGGGGGISLNREEKTTGGEEMKTNKTVSSGQGGAQGLGKQKDRWRRGGFSHLRSAPSMPGAPEASAWRIKKKKPQEEPKLTSAKKRDTPRERTVTRDYEPRSEEKRNSIEKSDHGQQSQLLEGYVQYTPSFAVQKTGSALARAEKDTKKSDVRWRGH